MCLNSCYSPINLFQVLIISVERWTYISSDHCTENWAKILLSWLSWSLWVFRRPFFFFFLSPTQTLCLTLSLSQHKYPVHICTFCIHFSHVSFQHVFHSLFGIDIRLTSPSTLSCLLLRNTVKAFAFFHSFWNLLCFPRFIGNPY